MDSRKCQTSTAAPAKPGDLPIGLGNIALRMGHRIEWDPKAFRITNCREGNQYVRREYRRGWDLKNIGGNARAREISPIQECFVHGQFLYMLRSQYWLRSPDTGLVGRHGEW